MPPNAVRIDGAPGNGRLFEAYRWAVMPAFDIDAPDKTERRNYRVSARLSSFNDMLVTRTRSSPLTYRRTERVIAHGGISDFVVEIYLSDRVLAEIEGREIQIRAGDIIVLDLTRRCEIVAGAHEVMSVALRRSEIERLASNPDDLHGTVLKARSPLARMLTIYVMSLEAEASKLEAEDVAPLVSSTAALVGYCIGAKAHDARQRQAAMAPSLFSLVRRGIEIALGDPNLDGSLVARQHGISRSSLYRMFAPYGGVNAYIRQRRLRRIYHDLSDPAQRDRRIATIAYRWGFTSEVSFSRAFRAAFGVSARDLRASAVHATAPARLLDGADRDAFGHLRSVLAGF